MNRPGKVRPVCLVKELILHKECEQIHTCTYRFYNILILILKLQELFMYICKLAISVPLLLSEQKDARDKERSAIKAREAFDELDLNKDGL